MSPQKDRLFKYIWVMFAIVVISLIKDPSMPNFMGSLAGFFLGVFYTMIGLTDNELDGYSKRKNKS